MSKKISEAAEPPVGTAHQTLTRYVHATDGPAWWCEGYFNLSVPVAFVGVGHAASPRGWAVYKCETCGDELFIDGRPESDTAAVERAFRAQASAADGEATTDTQPLAAPKEPTDG